MVCDLVVLSVLRVGTVEVCKVPQHGWEITVYSASVMSRPGGGFARGTSRAPGVPASHHLFDTYVPA